MLRQLGTLAFACCGAVLAQVAGNRLESVMQILDLERAGMEGIRAARDAEEQARAIKAYFARRTDVPRLVVQDKFSSGETEKARKTADEVMGHLFRATSGQLPSERGKNIDWDTNPYGDPEWLWGFHRWGWTRSLIVAYKTTGDDKYLVELASEVRSYVARMHREDAFPSDGNKGHMGWRQLDTAIRVQTLMPCLFLFARSSAIEPGAVVDCLYHMHACAARCMVDANPERSTVYNWNLTILDGGLEVALNLPELRDSAAWRELGLRTALAYAGRIMHEDGTSVEIIPGYHGVYVQWLQETKRRFADAGVDAEVVGKIDGVLKRSVDAQIAWSHPNGTPPLFGDTKGESIGGMQAKVRRELERNPRPEWQYYLTEGKEGTAPTERILQLPDAGYTAFRSDWTKDAVALIALNTNFEGKPRRGHCAADNMSFELSAFGKRLMCDSGSYVYWGKEGWHDYFRSAQAHQVLSLDDNLNASRGKTVVAKSVPGLDVAVLENQANEGFLHRRTFLFVDNRYFLVFDQAIGSAAGTLRQHFQFVPGEWVLDMGRLRARTAFAEGPNLLVASMRQPGVSVSAEDGWVSVHYTRKEPRPAFYFQQEKTADKDSHFLTLLAPMAEDQQIWHVDLSFLKEGRRTPEIQPRIYLCLNHQDAYLIDCDLANQTFAVEKRVYGNESKTSITGQINGALHKTGAWHAPGVIE